MGIDEKRCPTRSKRFAAMLSPPAQRRAIMLTTLLALFLGAMDALVVSAAMPTVVADLGGLPLYSWVYSAYFLARAVSLPIFGKLADLYSTRRLFSAAIGIFTLSSAAAGAAWNMEALIAARVAQGASAGGIFALVYIVLAEVAPEGAQGRMLATASAIWGIASVLGPSLGGFIVNFFSWRWVFFINVPLGLLSVCGIATFLYETRTKQTPVALDLAGVAALTLAILSFLFAFLLGGQRYPWGSPPILGLLALSLASTLLFVRVEHAAADPILPLALFRLRGFSAANAAVFMSSFAIFALFAFAPLFIQGAQGKSPMQVGLAMLALSLGWSLGSIALGQIIDRIGYRTAAAVGGLGLLAGSAMTLAVTMKTPLTYFFTSFLVIGIGMGFVALATLMTVQACCGARDLGVATASNQFARTLGGTVGVGVCGSFVSAHFSQLSARLNATGLLRGLPAHLRDTQMGQIENLLRPDVQTLLPAELRALVQAEVLKGVTMVFWAVVMAALLCLLLCLLLPGKNRSAIKI